MLAAGAVDAPRASPDDPHAHRPRAGVVLEGGEEVAADIVVAGIDPRRALLELSDPAWLDPELARSIGNVRTAGVAARIAFNAPSREHRVYAPSLDHLERAYDEVKHGGVSRDPYLEAHPSAGGVEVHFQYVPYGGQRSRPAGAARRLLPGLGDAQASTLWPEDSSSGCAAGRRDSPIMPSSLWTRRYGCVRTPSLRATRRRSTGFLGPRGPGTHWVWVTLAPPGITAPVRSSMKKVNDEYDDA